MRGRLAPAGARPGPLVGIGLVGLGLAVGCGCGKQLPFEEDYYFSASGHEEASSEDCREVCLRGLNLGEDVTDCTWLVVEWGTAPDTGDTADPGDSPGDTASADPGWLLQCFGTRTTVCM